MRLGHIVYWVADLEKTSRFLTEIVGWKRHPMEFGVRDDDPTTGGMKGAFFDAGGFWVELILPTTPGPGMEILKKKGAGAIVELNFEPADYDAALAAAKAMGVQMLNMDGTPIGADGGRIKEGVVENGSVSTEHPPRIAYFPVELSGATKVELFDAGTDPQGLLQTRDRMWQGVEPDPDSPRVSHIAIFVKDLEKSARFYTEVLKLRRHPRIFEIQGDANGQIGGLRLAYIHAGTVWLELVQPTGPGPILKTLDEEGDGIAAELVIEVDDLGEFAEQAKAKGVLLTGIDGTPFDDGQRYMVLDPYGTKAAYFPTGVSQGMVIEIIERGPRDTDLLHLRDAAWTP